MFGPGRAQQRSRQRGKPGAQRGGSVELGDERVEVARLLAQRQRAFRLASREGARFARRFPLARLERGEFTAPLGEPGFLGAEERSRGERFLLQLAAAG